MRYVYVISDLHIGGEAPQADEKRGFQLNTHVPTLARFIDGLTDKAIAPYELVINGDTVDFLAEEEFEAFTLNPIEAAKKLQKIIDREKPFFDALKRLLENGHALTILVGNHDIELALPLVRDHFLKAIGGLGNPNCKLLMFGEKYRVGAEVLVEHGNRYDSWNSFDYNMLKRLAEAQAKDEDTIDADYFVVPKGSYIVKLLMNPVKRQYRFVDLLKPETEAVFPILLALEPSLRGKVIDLWRINRGNAGDLESAGRGGTAASPDGEELLNRQLNELLGGEAETRQFLEGISSESGEGGTGGDDGLRERIAIGQAWGWLRLLAANADAKIEKRLPALVKALRVLQNDNSFARSEELLQEYWEAALENTRNEGCKHVIFGHTHFARKVPLGNGGYYINTGTWADLIKFPTGIVGGRKADAVEEVKRFLDEITGDQIGKHIYYKPTYAEICLYDDGTVCEIDLKDF